MTYQIAATADVDPSAKIGADTKVWHLAQIREGAELGQQCVVGRGAYIGTGVKVGDRCKIQNHALVYEPAVLGDGVFIGPAVVLTNDQYPRAISHDGRLKSTDDWSALGVTVEEGASLGARTVCLPGVTIGRYAVVGAGAVVTRDVPPFALVIGNPARFHTWVGHAGVPLQRLDEASWRCPRTGAQYRYEDGRLTPYTG